jgi:hypothetical protein
MRVDAAWLMACVPEAELGANGWLTTVLLLGGGTGGDGVGGVASGPAGATTTVVAAGAAFVTMAVGARLSSASFIMRLAILRMGHVRLQRACAAAAAANQSKGAAGCQAADAWVSNCWVLRAPSSRC